MNLRQRLSGINPFEWFLIGFALLIMAAAGFALGTRAVSYDTKDNSPLKQNYKQLTPKSQSTKQLQGQPGNPQNDNRTEPVQGGASELQQQDIDDTLYPYDPGPCRPHKPSIDRECIY